MVKQTWEEYDRIFHYTDQAGIEGIIRSNELHASHYSCLNDQLELFALKPKLRTIVEPTVEKALTELCNRSEKVRTAIGGKLAEKITQDAHSIIETLYNVSFSGLDGYAIDPFIVSFCYHSPNSYERRNGLLSQWRAYGRSAGYALEFDSRAITDAFVAEMSNVAHSGAHFSDVVYDGDDEKFSAEFAALVEAIQQLYSDMLFNNGCNLSRLFEPFIVGTTRYKHEGFREEAEIRLVVCPATKKDLAELESGDPKKWEAAKNKRIMERSYRSDLRPYVRILSGRTLSCLRRIIVGPHRNKELARDRLLTYLRMKELNIEVDISETPYS